MSSGRGGQHQARSDSGRGAGGGPSSAVTSQATAASGKSKRDARKEGKQKKLKKGFRSTVIDAVKTLQSLPQGATEEALLKYLRAKQKLGGLRCSNKIVGAVRRNGGCGVRRGGGARRQLSKLKRTGRLQQRGTTFRWVGQGPKAKGKGKGKAGERKSLDSDDGGSNGDGDGDTVATANQFSALAKGAAAAAAATAAVAAAAAAPGTPPVEEADLRADRSVEPKSLLHEEIVEMARRAEATPREKVKLQFAVERIQAVVQDLWGASARVALFGSQATGLALPGSDVDLVVLNVADELRRPAAGFNYRQRKQQEGLLQQLAATLRARGVVRAASVIGARVPIIKCVESASNLAMDIGLGAANGLAAVRFVTAQRERHAALRPLALVLKSLLAQRQLNEVFTGGLSSYALVNLVLAHLQAEARAGEADDDLGSSLLAFLYRYGARLDYRAHAVSVARGGIVARAAIPKVGPAKDGKLFIEDPQELGMDVGRGSFQMTAVRAAFAEALEALVASLRAPAPAPPPGSRPTPLNAVIRVEEAVGRRSAAAAALAMQARLQRLSSGESGGSCSKPMRRERRKCGALWSQQFIAAEQSDSGDDSGGDDDDDEHGDSPMMSVDQPPRSSDEDGESSGSDDDDNDGVEKFV